MNALIPARWRANIDALLKRQPRVILGLTGTPGAGKSSAAEAIATAYPDISVVVPMDGFHLANTELARLGLSAIKGAPETFDATGYAALLRRIRHEGETIIYAPQFRREIEEPIAGAIPVTPGHQLIITEGNYLLMGGAWSGVRPLLDACWYVDIPDEARVQRLIARHMRHGRSQTAATEWVLRSDEKNARLVIGTRNFADEILCWPPEAV